MKIINATPHPIVVRTPEGDQTFEPSGTLPRVSTIETLTEPIEGLPCVTQSMGDIHGLPDAVPGVVYIVSALVFGASDRTDLIAPDTGKGAVRDDKGRILGVTRFLRRG